MKAIRVRKIKKYGYYDTWDHELPLGVEFLVFPDLSDKTIWEVLKDNEENNKSTPPEWRNIQRYLSKEHYSVIGEEDISEEISDSKEGIIKVCDSIKEVLLEKNKRYGDSAINPKQIFSKLSGEEGIKIRLDDKLGRIMNSGKLRKNDVADLIGYLTLYSVSQNWTDFTDQID